MTSVQKTRNDVAQGTFKPTTKNEEGETSINMPRAKKEVTGKSTTKKEKGETSIDIPSAKKKVTEQNSRYDTINLIVNVLGLFALATIAYGILSIDEQARKN